MGKSSCQDVYSHNIIKKAVFSKEKFGFCSQKLDNFLKTDPKAILDSMETAFIEHRQMLLLKSSFYCIGCSRTYSSFITQDSVPSMKVSGGFCSDFVGKFLNYLQWRFRTFKSYAEKLADYAKCFKTEGNYWSPENLVSDPLPRIYGISNRSISSCLARKNLRSCLEICSKIQISGYSKLLDGDKGALIMLYNELINVLRTYGIYYSSHVIPTAVAPAQPAPPEPKLLKTKRVLEQGGKGGKRVKSNRHLGDSIVVSPRKTVDAPTPSQSPAPSPTPTPSPSPAKSTQNVLDYLMTALDNPEELEFTHENINDFDERKAARMMYQPIGANVDIINIKLNFVDNTGVNPLSVYATVNFDDTAGSSLVAAE
jgi:hypothetical protein